MTIIPMRRRGGHEDVPLIAFIDLQSEYIADGRAMKLEDTSGPLENCARLLAFARQQRLPVAHFRLRQSGHLFNEGTGFSGWIKGFEPRSNEYIYERRHPSCFTNEAFARLLQSIAEPKIVFAGLCAQDGCLATAVDIQRLGYDGAFVKDCSSSKCLASLASRQSLDLIYELISGYANVTDVAHVIQAEVRADRIVSSLVS